MSKIVKGVKKVFKGVVKVVKKVWKPLVIAAAIYFTAGMAAGSYAPGAVMGQIGTVAKGAGTKIGGFFGLGGNAAGAGATGLGASNIPLANLPAWTGGSAAAGAGGLGNLVTAGAGAGSLFSAGAGATAAGTAAASTINLASIAKLLKPTPGEMMMQFGLGAAKGYMQNEALEDQRAWEEEQRTPIQYFGVGRDEQLLPGTPEPEFGLPNPWDTEDSPSLAREGVSAPMNQSPFSGLLGEQDYLPDLGSLYDEEDYLNPFLGLLE